MDTHMDFGPDNWFRVEMSIEDTPQVTKLVGDNETLTNEGMDGDHIITTAVQLAHLIYHSCGNYDSITVIKHGPNRLRYDINMVCKSYGPNQKLHISLIVNESTDINSLWFRFIVTHTNLVCEVLDKSLIPDYQKIDKMDDQYK